MYNMYLFLLNCMTYSKTGLLFYVTIVVRNGCDVKCVVLFLATNHENVPWNLDFFL